MTANVAEGMDAEAQAKLVEELTAFTQGAPLASDVEAPDDDDIETVSIERPGRQLSTAAPLRDLRARASDPA